MMKVLIACEYSGIVRDAFIAKGHNAWSCDILPTESIGNHICGDVLKVLNEGWDLMIAHPPCTYLTTTGNKWYLNNPKRWKSRFEAMLFVWKLWNAPINKIAIENPKGVISTHIRKPDQYIQPYEYGYPETKMTGLWLKNLSLLKPTNVVEPQYKMCKKGKRYSPTHWENPGAKERSKTRPEIAKAMADQWG